MPTSEPLKARVARYERIIAMRGDDDNPKMSLEAIGATFDPPLSRQRVEQIIHDGRPKPNGRPRSKAKLAEMRRKLGVWEDRRTRAIAEGRDTSVADRRIAALSAELAGA